LFKARNHAVKIYVSQIVGTENIRKENAPSGDGKRKRGGGEGRTGLPTPSLSLLGLPGRTGGRGRQQRGSPKENSEFARYSIRSDLKIIIYTVL
jgi:hypothetical protein